VIEQLNSRKNSEKAFFKHIEGNNWSSSRSLKIGINYMILAWQDERKLELNKCIQSYYW